MAYTQVQVITDTDRRHVVKRVNVANTETDTLVVNAAALAYAVTEITTLASANGFEVGETINATSGGVGVVQDVPSPTKITVINVTGTFANNDTLRGVSSGRTRTQSGSIVRGPYQLQVSNILYDVQGDKRNESVTLTWEGTGGGANNRTIVVLQGQGQFDLAAAAARITNNANTPTGNITLTTNNWDQHSHYTLVLDVAKQEGYAFPYLQRNALGRY